MMNDIKLILKKELYRFFSDKKLVFSVVILPALTIFIMYTFLGIAMEKKFSDEPTVVKKIMVQHLPSSLQQNFQQLNITMVPWDDNASHLLANKEIDCYVVFPTSFEEDIASKNIPIVSIYYNSTEPSSYHLYNSIYSLLSSYEQSLENVFDNNSYDVASEKDYTGEAYSMLLPMLIISFIFSGALSVSSDMIAGEKERGVMASLLVTPIKRSSIAIGKIISTSIITLCSGLSGFLGTIVSLPSISNIQSSISYSLLDYGLLLLIICSTIFFVVSLLLLISSLSTSVKQASSLSSPLTILAMLASISTMMNNKSINMITALIPVLNTSSAMSQVLSFQLNTTYLVITIIINFIVSLIFMKMITINFSKEHLLFH